MTLPNNVLLKGSYKLESSTGRNVKCIGRLITFCTAFYSYPITGPIWWFGKHPKLPEYLYLEIE